MKEDIVSVSLFSGAGDWILPALWLEFLWFQVQI